MDRGHVSVTTGSSRDKLAQVAATLVMLFLLGFPQELLTF